MRVKINHMKMQTIQRVNKMQTIDVDFEPYPLRVTFSENGIYSCKIVKSIEYSTLNKLTTSEKNVLDGLYSWIESYQSGTFDCELPILDFSETPNFRENVYSELIQVKAGQRVTYGQLANQVGSPKAARAIGTAMAKNRHVPIIPCHRVIRSDGSLGNYSGYGGVTTKAHLLDHEMLHASTEVSEVPST